MKSIFSVLLGLVILSSCVTAGDKPNLVFILADDMGYGDMTFRGGKVDTPYCDQLAAEGMVFTDAHTSSSVCTPTRYGIITGRYNWRSTMKKGVLWGKSEPLIEEERVTVGDFLQSKGYHTGAIGKWHLGLGWVKSDEKGKEGVIDGIDFTQPIKSPIHQGFDYFFGIPASLDMPPYVYVKNDKATEIPTATKKFVRSGPAGETFEAVNCLRDFAAESRAFIKRNAKSDKPFFLYLPLTSPHTPIVPSESWQGKSPVGPYGDFLMETDWVIGQVLAELKEQGVDDNTMVLFTTDNGCSPAAKIPDLIKQGHVPNGPWRGHKADIFEGGHRVPFIVRWPGKIKAGTLSDSLVCTTDYFATVVDLCGGKIDDKTAEDSFSFLPDLLGKGTTERRSVVHHSINGSFAIREGDWKLNLCPGSGGWSAPKPGKATIGLPVMQLYNLQDDPKEQANLYETNPEKTASLIKTLSGIIKNGRSTPGTVQPDDKPDFQFFSEDILSAAPDLKM